jgi:hypothetical protein
VRRKKGDSLRVNWTLRLKIGPDGNRDVQIEAELGEAESVKETVPAIRNYACATFESVLSATNGGEAA